MKNMKRIISYVLIFVLFIPIFIPQKVNAGFQTEQAKIDANKDTGIYEATFTVIGAEATSSITYETIGWHIGIDFGNDGGKDYEGDYYDNQLTGKSGSMNVVLTILKIFEELNVPSNKYKLGGTMYFDAIQVVKKGKDVISPEYRDADSIKNAQSWDSTTLSNFDSYYNIDGNFPALNVISDFTLSNTQYANVPISFSNDSFSTGTKLANYSMQIKKDGTTIQTFTDDSQVENYLNNGLDEGTYTLIQKVDNFDGTVVNNNNRDLIFDEDIKETTFTLEPIRDLTAIEKVPKRAGLNESYTVTGEYSIAENGQSIIAYRHQKSIGNMSNWQDVSTAESFQESYNTESLIYYRVMVKQTNGEWSDWSVPVVIEISDNTPTSVNAELNMPSTVYEGVDVSIDTIGSKVIYGEEALSAYNAVSRGIADYDYNFSCNYSGSLSPSGGTVSFNGTGNQTAEYELETSMDYDIDREVFNVIATPYITKVLQGQRKENRKLTCDFNSDIFHQDHPINLNNSYVKVIDLQNGQEAIFNKNISNSTYIKGRAFSNNNIDFIIKQPGIYKVIKYVEDTRGHSDTEEITIEIVEDLPPVAQLNLMDEYYRDETGIVNFNVEKKGYSPDLDLFQTNKIWYRIDRDNDGNFSDETYVTLSSSLSELRKIFSHNKVGKVQFRYDIRETYNTLTEYVTTADYLLSRIYKTIEIQNYAPYTSLDFISSYDIDLKLVGDVTSTVNSKTNTMISNITSQRAVNFNLIDSIDVDIAGESTPIMIQNYNDNTILADRRRDYDVIAETGTTILYDCDSTYVARNVKTGTIKYMLPDITIRYVPEEEGIAFGRNDISDKFIELNIDTGEITEYDAFAGWYTTVVKITDNYLYAYNNSLMEYYKFNRNTGNIVSSFTNNDLTRASGEYLIYFGSGNYKPRFLGFYNNEFYFAYSYMSSTRHSNSNNPTNVGVSIYKKGFNTEQTLVKRYSTSENRVYVSRRSKYYPLRVENIYGSILSNGNIVISYMICVEYDDDLYSEKRRFLGLTSSGTIKKNVLAYYRTRSDGLISSNTKYNIGYTYHENYYSIDSVIETDNYFYAIWDAPYEDRKVHQFNKNTFSTNYDYISNRDEYYVNYTTLKAFEETGKMYYFDFDESNKYTRSYLYIRAYEASTGNKTTLKNGAHDNSIYYHEDPRLIIEEVKGNEDYLCVVPCRYDSDGEYTSDEIFMLNIKTGELFGADLGRYVIGEQTVRPFQKDGKIYIQTWLQQGFVIFDISAKTFSQLDYINNINNSSQLLHLNAVNTSYKYMLSLMRWNTYEEIQIFEFPDTLKKLKEYITDYSDDKDSKYMVIVENNALAYNQTYINEVTAACNAANIKIIWMGKSSNRSTGQALANATGGLYINNSSLTTSFNTLEDYILNELPDIEPTPVIYKTKGELIEYNTSYLDLENDPIYSGAGEQWRYTMDNSKPHPDGVPSWSGVWRTSRFNSINYTGEYDIEYRVKDNPTTDNRFSNYRKWSIPKSARLIISGESFLESVLVLDPAYPKPVAPSSTLDVTVVTTSSKVPSKVEAWIQGGSKIELTQSKISGNNTTWKGTYTIPSSYNGDYTFYSRAYMDALQSTDNEQVKVVPNRAPTVNINNLSPAAPIIVGTDVSMDININDPDNDNLDLNIRVYKDGSLISQENRNVIPPYNTIDYVLQEPVPGNYRVRAYVSDEDGLYDVDNIYFTVERDNQPPTVTLTNLRPSFIYEGDTVNININMNDPDGDNLDLNIKAYKNGTLISNTNQNIISEDYTLDYRLLNDAALGNYTVNATVTDPENETDTDSISFTVHELDITGQVRHTDRWNENRIKYNQSKTGTDDNPRRYNVFWSGEKFILYAQTTNVNSSSNIKADTVICSIQNEGYTDILSSLDNENWNGEIAETTTINKWGNDSPETITFEFKVTYSNGKIKKHVLDIIIDNTESYYRLHKIY